MRTVKLLGIAGRTFVRELRLEVASAAEAVRALCALYPEFRPWVIAQAEKGVAWRVVGDGRGLGEDTLALGGSGTLVFAPILEGSGGGGGVWGIVTGVALIAISFIPGIGLGAVAGIRAVGIGLALHGVATLLSTTAKTPLPTSKDPTELDSNLFGRGTSSDAQGEIVPVLYGRRLITNPRVIFLDLGLLPKDRNINRGGTVDLIGFIGREGVRP